MLGMDTPPYDETLRLLLNKSARLAFVQGEDRTILVQVQSEDRQAPFDLTGYAVIFALPKSGGGSIKRVTMGLPVTTATAQTLNGQSIFTYTGHGLVAGDVVTLAASGSNQLPPPFTADATYIVDYKTKDTFGLLSSTYAKVALTAATSTNMLLSTGALEVSQAVLGELTLDLTAAVTSAAATGQGASYQLTLIDPQGRVRIIIGDGQLDVLVPPCP